MVALKRNQNTTRRKILPVEKLLITVIWISWGCIYTYDFSAFLHSISLPWPLKTSVNFQGLQKP